MAKYSNVVTYDIKTTLDASGITKLYSELNKVQTTLNNLNSSPKKLKSLGLNIDEVEGYRAEIEQLSRVLSTTFNTRTGMLDLNKFNAALNNGTINAERLSAAFNAAGNQGKIAFNSLVTSITTLNKNAITANSALTKIANTFGNTVRWGITASIVQEMMSSVQGAVSYMKDLDESLTNIQMVTNSSKEDMRELAQYANNAAQALGSTTTDYTNAVKVFVQEGFSESESKQYANLSTKLANVSEQSTDVTSDQITAYRNAFQLDYQQTVEAMDKVANVANNTASNVNELMTASQRAASVAQAVGSSQDSFLAAIATIESVTRQSAEEIGNGLKTIYQRFADIKVSGSTDDGVDYGQYAKALKSVGVDVLDVAGQFKGMDQILSELQDVWSELDDTMKIAVGEKVAGKFQYNRFAALMNNPEYYQKALGATQGANGMMDQMNEYYIEGIEGRLNTLQTAGEQVMSTLFDQDNIEPVIGAATDFLNIINTIVDAVGGGMPVFTALSAVILKMFSAQISEQTARIATNINTMIQGGQNVKQMQTTLTGLQASGIATNTDTYKYAKNSVGSMVGLSSNTQQEWSNTIAKSAEIEEQKLQAEEKYNEVVGLANSKLEARYKISSQIKDMEASKSSITKEEIVAFEQIKEILSQTIILDEENFSIDQNLLKQKVAIAKLLAEGKDLTYQEVMAESEKIDLLGTDLNITESILQAERERQAAQQQHNAQKEVQKQLDERMSMEQQGKSITNLVSGLTSVVFLAQSAASIWQTWTDENTSFEDKVISSLMSLVMILPMVTTAWQALTAVKWADIAASTTGVAIASKDIIVKGLQVIANNTLAKATGIATVAQWALNAAMDANPIGLVIVAIAALIAIIGRAIVLYSGWQESIHASSKEFEAQQELLNKTKKNYSEIREEVDALKQSIDSIGEAKSSLTDLTEGTDEWREAVRKLNDQILTLLQTYPELAQYVTNEDGVLNISDIGMNQFYQKQLDEADHLASVNSVQQINTLQAQNKKYIEDFYNQWGMGKGLSKEEIEMAISNGAVELKSGADELNAAFAELVNKVQINSTSIDNLSDNIGTLNTTYSDYSSKEDINFDEVKESIRSQYSNVFGPLTFDSAANSAEFKQLVADATGINPESIKGIHQKDLFSPDWTVEKKDGSSERYSQEDLLNLLADSQIAIDETNRKLEENKIIFETFGARYDEASKKFIDSSGETVSSLEDLNGVTDNEIAAIKAFQDGIYNDIAVKDFYGSLGEFVTELKNGTLSVDGFSKALLATQVQRKEEGIFGNEGKLTSLLQTQGIQTPEEIANIDGVPENLKLSSGQAKAIMADMMKKLNESDLSDDEKLQLMDKIDWNMPVQDILANIQHAIDTGNINSAFVDTIGLEDDSERKSKVLEDYDIDESTLNAYTEQLKTTGELAEQHEELANSLEYAKKQFGEESDEAKNASKALTAFNDESEDMAVDLAQTQKGLESLSNNMAEYGDILKNGDKTTLEYAEALGTVKKALADTLNVSEENISNSLIENHLQDIEALAAGDEEALNRLRAAAGQDIAIGFYMSEDSNLTEGSLQLLEDKALELSSLDIEVGANVNDEQFVNALNNMMANGELTKDQVNEYLHSIGVEPHFETDTIDTDIFNTAGMYVRVPLPWGGDWDIQIPSFALRGQVQVPKITAGKDGGGTGLKRTASPTAPSGKSGISPNYVNDSYKPKGSNKSPKNGSSKQSKNNEKKKKQKSEWDYLTDITNDLERQSAIIEKLSKLEDRLYGANRVKQLKTLQVERQKNIKLLQQEEKIAKKHAERLRTRAKDENGNLTINGYAYRAGISQLKFDGQGNLDNGRQIEQALLARVNQATKDYNRHRNGNNASYYNQKLDNAKSDYDGFLKAMSEYESTLGKIEDAQSQIQEQKEQIQDAADAIVDSIQEGIEDVLKAMDSQREFDRMYRNWQEGGNSYSHFGSDRQYYAEGLANLLSPSNNGKSIFDTQLESLRNRINDAKEVFDNDSSDADDEKLSEQDAFENLQEATEYVMDSLNKMMDYYDSLIKTIQEASDKMDELIDNRLEEFDRLEDYLDTRLDQLTLLFGDKSYEEQSEFYNQKILVNMEKMASINTAIEQKQATVEALEKIEATNKELSSEERQELKDARDKVNELQEEQLNTETKLLQDIADKLRTQTSAEMDSLVNSLFNGADVEWLSEQWEIATRNSEKYLDDYNRAFELEKLQLKFQEALNDSQNTSLKTQQKIAALGDEYLTYLREKDKLSEYDVKHAEAQLNILQKQIALEEARDNKSQMRLQRNAAGNYDFVYAADQDAMNQAAEALLAAQQESYNLSKQMYLDTYNSAYEAALKTKEMVVSIATDASLSVEERVERIKFVLNGLNEYLQGSSVELNEISINLYNDFVGAEQLIAEENQGNLSAIFEQMRQETAALMQEINAGINSVKETGATGLEEFQGTLSTAASGIEETVSTTLGNIGTMVSDNMASTGETISNAIGNITDSIVGEEGLQGTLLSAFNKIGEGGSNSFDTMAENITKESEDGHLQRIKVGTINTADEINTYITKTTLPTINKNFVLSGEAAIKQVNTIDAEIKKTIEKICGKEGEIGGYLGNFKKSTDEALQLAGQSYKNFKETSLKTVKEGLEELQGETQEWQDDLSRLNQEIRYCANEVSYWKGQIDATIGSTKDLIFNSNKLQVQLGSLAAQAATTSGKVNGLSSSADYATNAQYNAADAAYTLADGAYDVAGAADSAAGSASNAAGAYRDMASAAYEAAAAAREAARQMSSYNGTFRSSGGGRFGNSSSSGGDWYWDGYTYQYYGFATGGYTGTWSDHGIDDKNGKLAILHQKELVLNADDTKNMLSTVELVRDIMSNINTIPSLGKNLSSNNLTDTIEQRVEINATFPGVTEVEDIKRAITGLADSAYQYANRYKY